MRYNLEASRELARRINDEMAQHEASARARSEFSSEVKVNEKIRKGDHFVIDNERFDAYLRQIRENHNAFTCQHKRFYWHACQPCRRDAEQARHCKAYYRDKVVAALRES